MNIIVAVDKNWGIGKDGDLLVSLKPDMAFFRRMTEGKTVILGRKTLESFPGGNPLKGRTHIVFSRTLAADTAGIHVIKNLETLKKLNMDLSDSFVIGGEAVYRLMLPYCETAYITKIDRAFDADTYFPDLDALPNWQCEEILERFSENGVNAEIIVYHNTNIKPL